jgi:hypothetical protein
VKAFVWSDGKRYYHYSAGRPERKLVVLGSADGAEFHETTIQSKLSSQRPNAFDGGGIFWSEAEQLFVGYFRWWDRDAKPHARTLQDWMLPQLGDGVRSVFRATSKDLVEWSPEQPMSYGDTPREHFYESGTHPYFRAPDLYVALANRFNPGRRALSLEEERELAIRSVPGSRQRRLSLSPAPGARSTSGRFSRHSCVRAQIPATGPRGVTTRRSTAACGRPARRRCRSS